MKRQTWIRIGLTLWLGLSWVGFVEAEVPSTRITFNRALYFHITDGSALVEPDVYDVAPLVGRHLRLQAAGRPPIFLEADVSLHEEAVDQAEAALLPDEENPELHHLVLLLPDGQLLEALGSTSGMSTRGFKKPWKSSGGIRSFGKVRRQPPTGQSPQHPAQASQSTASASPGATASPPPQESATQEGTGEFVGMVTWGYLRMHHPEMVLEELKQAQTGKLDPSMLNGLAHKPTLQRLLASDLSQISLPPGQPSGVVSRGLFGKIGSPSMTIPGGLISELKNPPPPASPPSSSVPLSPPPSSPERRSPTIPPPTPSQSPGPDQPPSKFQEKSLGAQYAKEAWTSILAGPGNISPDRQVPLPVDYFPATLNLGRVWDKQISKATLHLVAPSGGTVTASMPEGAPFRVIEIQTYSGKINPSSPNPDFQATRRVTHRPDFPQETLIAPPFRLPVKAGQDVTVTVEFAPKFNLFNQAAGPKTTTLHVEGTRWGADVPVTGFFEGLPLGVIATLETYDVVFIQQYGHKGCNLRAEREQNLDKLPLVATFTNTDSETHVVAVRPERLDGKGYWTLQPFDLTLKGHETRQVTMTLEGDRCKPMDTGIFDSEIRYHFYEGSTKPGGTRSLRFGLSVYPGTLYWENRGSVGSCDYTWHYTAHSDGYQYLYTQVRNKNLIWNMDFLVEIYLLNTRVAAVISHPHRTEAGVVKSHGFNQSFIQNNWTALYGAKPGYKVGCTMR